MATFLTSPRMNPALRARVERAVSRRKRAKANAARLGLDTQFDTRTAMPIARLLPIVGLGLVIALGLVVRARDRRAFEEQRNGILQSITARRATLAGAHGDFLTTTDRTIAEAASEAALPDWVDPSMRGKPAFEAVLKKPAVYVHAQASALRDSKTLDDAAGASTKDAFLWCLYSPPPSASERDLLAKVDGVYLGGAKVDEETRNVRRLSDARMGLSVLAPDFEASVRDAKTSRTLVRLKRELDDVPIEQVEKAARAEVLIVVSEGVPSTDGPKSRVTVVDLASQHVLLRVNRATEDKSPTLSKSSHREQVASCGLALATRKKAEE